MMETIDSFHEFLAGYVGVTFSILVIGLFFYSIVRKIVISLLYSNPLKVENKHIFITGGSSGLGLSIAKDFAKKGANVTIVARNQEKLDKALEEVKASAKNGKEQKFLALSADVTNYESLENASKLACAQFGPVYGLICNAGVAVPGLIENSKPSVYRNQMEVNYLGTVHAVKCHLRNFKVQNEGIIVFVSSAVVFGPMVGYSMYCPSKVAVKAFGDCLRNEIADTNIYVAQYYPSNLDTPGYEIENMTKPDATKEIEGANALLTPDDASAILMKGLKQRQYHITSELLVELGRIDQTGIAPRENLIVELLLIPILPIVSFVYMHIADFVVKMVNRRKKKEN